MESKLLMDISGLIAVISFMPYIYDVVKNDSKPAQVTWFFLSAVNAITVLNTIDLGVPLIEVGPHCTLE